MKIRILALVLVLVCCVCLCSCSQVVTLLSTFRGEHAETVEGDAAGAIVLRPGANGDSNDDNVNDDSDEEDSFIAVIPGEDGVVSVIPDTGENEQRPDSSVDVPEYEVAPEPTFFTINETWNYFHLYASDDNLDQARLATLSLREDGTFGLGACLQVREKGADATWYCPGTETSGVDTPYWEGTYTWDGTMLNLTFEYRLQTVYEEDEYGMTPVGDEQVPVEFYVVMTCIEKNRYGYYMDATPLPLYSDLAGLEAGYVQMYVGETLDLDTLFP